MNESWVPEWALGPDEAQQVIEAAANELSPKTLDAVVNDTTYKLQPGVDVAVGIQPVYRMATIPKSVGNPFGTRYSIDADIEYLDPISRQVVLRYGRRGGYPFRRPYREVTTSVTLDVVVVVHHLVALSRMRMRSDILDYPGYRKILAPVRVETEEIVEALEKGHKRPFEFPENFPFHRLTVEQEKGIRDMAAGNVLSGARRRSILRALTQDRAEPDKAEQRLAALRGAGAVVGEDAEAAVLKVLRSF